jgi:hypothetical protein
VRTPVATGSAPVATRRAVNPPPVCRDLLFALLSGLQECNWRLALDQDASWSRSSVVQCVQAALRPVTTVKEPFHLSCAPRMHANNA